MTMPLLSINTHALKAKDKAKAISSSEEVDVSECSTYDAEEIGQELAIVVRKFQKFSKRNCFGKSSKYDSKNTKAYAHDYEKRTCQKCKKTGHYIADCPLRKKGSKKKRSSKDDDSDDKKKKLSKSSSKKKAPSAEPAPSLERKWILRKLRNLTLGWLLLWS